MNTFLSRLNALFAFSLTVAAGVTFATFLTTHFRDNSEDAEIEVNKIIIKNIEEFYVGEKHDLAHMQFSLKANFSSLFHWNSKMLFMYLMAEYETPDHPVNQIVLWDHIMNREDDHVINIKKSYSKYYFFDEGSNLRGRDIKLSLNWNVIPNSGYLWMVPARGSKTITLPSSYASRRS